MRDIPGGGYFHVVHLPGSVSEAIECHRIHTSPLQRIPGAKRRYRYMLPLMPTAVRMFSLGEYDFILSSSHCVAKGARGGYETYHLSYCHTPMRYAWSGYEDYSARLDGAAKWVFPRLVEYLRKWDNEANRGVHDFIANSYTVAERIRRYYGRQAEVLYPPVDTEFYQSRNERVSDYYLMVTAFAPYKRVEAAVEAFGRLGRPLKVVGGGRISSASECWENRTWSSWAGRTMKPSASFTPGAAPSSFRGRRTLASPRSRPRRVVVRFSPWARVARSRPS